MVKHLLALLCVLLICLPLAASGKKETPATGEGAAVAAQVATEGLKIYATLAEYEKTTGIKISSFAESPVLAAKVKTGELPAVEKRLPSEPLVISPLEQIGRYGGTARAISPKVDTWIDVGFGLSSSEPILALASDGSTIIPNVAKKWEYSSDGKTLTLYFRKDMKWSDGQPFTANDIYFWYEDVVGNDDLTPVKPKFWSPGGELMKMEKIDDYTIRLGFAAPYPMATLNLTHWQGVQQQFYLPKHALTQYHVRYTDKAKLEAMAKELEHDQWYQLFLEKRTSFAHTAQIGEGFPVLRSFVLAKKGLTLSRLERNPYYWKIDTAGNQLPYIDAIQVTRVDSVEVANMKAISGEADLFAHYTAVINYPLYKENEAKGGFRTLLWSYGWGSVLHYSPNHNHNDPVMRKIIRDKRFRIALSISIDRDEINKVIFFGKAVPRQTTNIPSSKFFEPEFARAYAEHDPDKANQLLDEMGLKWDKNKEWRLRPDGKQLNMLIEYRSASPEFDAKQKINELVESYWEKLGINIVLKPIDRPLLEQRARASEHDMTLWNTDYTTDALFPINPLRFVPISYGGSKYAPKWAQWYSTGGKAGEEPPEDVKRTMDLYDLMQVTMDEQERIRAGKEILKHQAEELMIIGTVGMAPKVILVSNKMRNVTEEGSYAWDFFFMDLYSPEQFFFTE